MKLKKPLLAAVLTAVSILSFSSSASAGFVTRGCNATLSFSVYGNAFGKEEHLGTIQEQYSASGRSGTVYYARRDAANKIEAYYNSKYTTGQTLKESFFNTTAAGVVKPYPAGTYTVYTNLDVHDGNGSGCSRTKSHPVQNYIKK